MYRIKKMLLPALFITCFAQSNAQVPPQYRAAHNQMLKTHHLNMVNRHGSMHFYSYNSVANYKREYTVMLKDSSKMVVKSKFELDTIQKKFYLQHIDIKKRKSDSTRIRRIYPDETVGITVRAPSGWATNQGLSADSCWLFPEIKGRITVYTMLADITVIDEEYVRAYSVDDGPVLPWDLQAIREVLSEDPDSKELMNEGKYLKAIKQFNRKTKKGEKKNDSSGS